MPIAGPLRNDDEPNRGFAVRIGQFESKSSRANRLSTSPLPTKIRLAIREDLRAGVAEWQTRWIQNPVWATMCGFKSHLRYFRNDKGLRREA